MMLLGEEIFKFSWEKEAKVDSTPLEASRYDKHADYNPHYESKMDKAHITMVGTFINEKEIKNFTLVLTP